jgi:ABC-type dipeptide/oligopeptide/nickel transport system ATPase component
MGARRVDEYPFQLSGGLRQRVMIAMALLCDPRVLIADEPANRVRSTTQAQVLDLLRHLQRERGLAIILITHDMGVIAEMAHDVAVTYLSRAVESGPMSQIFAPPQHPHTRALLRSISTVHAEPRTRHFAAALWLRGVEDAQTDVMSVAAPLP